MGLKCSQIMVESGPHYSMFDYLVYTEGIMRVCFSVGQVVVQAVKLMISAATAVKEVTPSGSRRSCGESAVYMHGVAFISGR